MNRILTRLTLSITLAAALLGSLVLPSGNNAKADEPAQWTYNPSTPGTYTNTAGTPGSYTYNPVYVANHALICTIIGC